MMLNSEGPSTVGNAQLSLAFVGKPGLNALPTTESEGVPDPVTDS